MPWPTPATGRSPSSPRPRRSGAGWAQHEPALPLRNRCHGCGVDLDHHQRSWCAACWPNRRAGAGLAGSAKARELIDTPASSEARGLSISAGRAAAGAARARALGWEPGDWSTVILPGLKAVGLRAAQLREATGLSLPLAYKSLEGRQVPDPRRWEALAVLAAVELPAKRGCLVDD